MKPRTNGRYCLFWLLIFVFLTLNGCDEMAPSSAGVPQKAVSGSRFAREFESIYDDPDTDSKAWTRYWVSAAYYTEERVDYEMKSMADAGIGIVELQNSYYWCDTDYHKNVFLWILRAADKYGLKLDFAGGTSYPSSMPATSAYYDVNNMVHKLAYGSMNVESGETYDGAIPLPQGESGGGMGLGGGMPEGGMPGGAGAPGEPAAWEPDGAMPGQGGMPEGAGGFPPDGGMPSGTGGNGTTAVEPVGNAIAVVAVHVVREDTYSTGGGFMGGTSSNAYAVIDSVIDLTDAADIDNGTLQWTAPVSAGGHWEILGFWKVLSSQTTIDYLSRATSEAYCQYWDNEVLYSDEVRTLFNKVGRNFWEDSLESITINWTDELIDKFEKNRGYEFPREMMPTLLIKGMYSMGGSVNAPSAYEMEGDVDRRFRNDFFETLSDLYNDNHLAAIQDFIKTHYGMGFKCQVAYNYALDATSATMVVDYPEYEGLDSNDETDAYRVFAGAMHTSGKKTFSSENCARMLNFSTDIYRVKFRDWLWHVNVSYSGGNNASVYHGVEAAYSDTQWPGKSAVGPGFAESFGPRMPYWQYMDETVDSYIARTQKVLQVGQPKMDLAIFFNWFDYGLFAGDKGWVYYTDRGLEGAGYSYDFISTASLNQEDAVLKNGRLFSNGPAYKAIVLNAGRAYNTVLGTRGSGMIPLASARKILELAKGGLPVLVIGDAPSRTLDYGTYEDGKGDKAVQEAMAELLSLGNVVQVKTEADAVDGLARLGVTPDAQFQDDTLNLSSFHRATDDADFYFLFNRTHSFTLSGEPFAASNLNTDEAETLETTISFNGNGVPYLLDAWTGNITPIAEYTREGDRCSIQVKLGPSDTRIIALAGENFSGGVDAGHVEENNTRATVVYRDGELVAYAGAVGSYSFTTDDGKQASAMIETVPEKINLSDWTLRIESWEPNDAYKAGDLGSDNANVYEIVKKKTDIDGDGEADTYTLKDLKPWKEIDPALQGVSGVGYYETSVMLPTDWDGENAGYVLDLGSTCEIFQVYVNGRKVDFNQFYPSADITEYLKLGLNVIRVEVASTIFNAAKKWNQGILNDRDREGYWESYGLLGPVTLVPYGSAEIEL
jgi:hypothetical protein